MDNRLNDRSWLHQEYVVNQRSFGDIAKELGTYPNRVRRSAIKMGIEPRDKSEAQSVALKEGRHSHPTKGTTRPEDVKIRIADKVSKNWENMPEDEKQRRIEISKAQWEKMSPKEKEALQKAAGDAIRKSSKEGSKLEKFVYDGLTKQGYRVDFHVEKLIRSERLQIDMFVPGLTTAIEIDGPSHFLPIWGDDNLYRNMKSDQLKNGLILSAGFAIIRVKQTRRNLSTKMMRDILSLIIEKLEEIKTNFPPQDKRLMEIEV